MSNDPLWLLASYVYVAAVIAAGTLARAGGRRSPDLTRKVIHVGVGSWIIPTAALFTSPLLAIVPPLSFIAVNLLSWRFKLVAAMEEGDRNPGTIYFPLAFVLVTLLFWPGAWARLTGQQVGLPTDDLWGRLPVAAGIMTMAWGDAAASIFGRRMRGLRYRVAGGATKSLGGSLACALFAFLGIMVAALVLAAAERIEPGAALRAALPAAVAAALVATLAEAVTPFGLDNLSVPLLAAAVMRWLVARPPMTGHGV